MIRDRDFLVLSDDWNGLPTSTIHLFRHIVRANRVFWLRIINRLPRLHAADFRKVKEIVRDWRPARFHVRSSDELETPGPMLKTPVIVPYFTKPFRAFNHWSLRRTYRQICDSEKVEQPILLTTFPSTADFVKTVSAKLKIYYCVDDWSCYPGLDHRRIDQLEQELIEAVDGVVVTSRQLEAKIDGRRPTLYLPQGVDFAHFHAALEAHRLVEAMEPISQPIVGFFGLVGDWVDLGLIANLAEQLPAVSFVYLGGFEIPEENLPQKPNLHWLGRVAYGDLPSWARYFDLGIIPFKVNDLTKAVNPLKLMEYFALGLPVVSTCLPELQGQPGPVRLAADAREFSRHIEFFLTTTTKKDREEAVAIARGQTWGHRVQRLNDFIATLER